jgi:quinol monooxygenase YgiN
VASERRIGDANPQGAIMSTGTLSPTVALVVKLVAKPDKADEVSTFLADAVSLANQEQGTIAWFALRTDTTTFWIVDAFPSDRERKEHLEGAIAASLLANAERLLDGPPEILPADVLAAKLPQ